MPVKKLVILYKNRMYGITSATKAAAVNYNSVRVLIRDGRSPQEAFDEVLARSFLKHKQEKKNG